MKKILRAMVVFVALIFSAIKSTIFAVFEVPVSLMVIYSYYDPEVVECGYWRFVGEVFAQLYTIYRDQIIEFIEG